MAATPGYFSKKFVVDLIERTVATYIESFIGLLTAGAVFDLDVSVLKIAAVGAFPAALAVLKGAISKQLGSDQSSAAAVAVQPTAAQAKAAK